LVNPKLHGRESSVNTSKGIIGLQQLAWDDESLAERIKLTDPHLTLFFITYNRSSGFYIIKNFFS